MDRRELLALCGAGAGFGALAGCTGDSRDADAETAPSPGATDTPPGGSSPTSTPVDPLDGSWESYRRDAGNTAGTDDPGPTGSPAEAWRFATTTGDPTAAPVAADGAFFVVTHTGVLYAREATDGAVRWSRTWPDTGVDPVASGGTVVLADGDTLVGFAVDTGEHRWRESLDGSVTGLATTDGGVVAATERELVTVAPGDGTERWRTGVGDDLMLAVADGTVYGMGYDTPVLALDPSDGSVLGRHGGFRGTTSPALADEYLFVGDDTGRVRVIGPESG